MPLFDTIKYMQQQGLSEAEIVNNLKSQGFSPLEISQAIEQARIKVAISEPSTTDIGEEMEPSVMETPSVSTQPFEEPTTEFPQTPPTPEYIYPTPQAYYPAYEQYEPYQTPTIETMTDVAEQIYEEKISRTKKELMSLEEFKTVTEREVKNIDERLKRIEEIIDRLQATILGKIGNYSQNIEEIKNEMEMMQESFSKALPSLIEKPIEKQAKQQAEVSSPKEKRRKSAIEHYLRR